MNIKQFLVLMRQQHLFNIIYILCTALSVAFTMTLFLVIYIKFGPIYPEENRPRMAVLSWINYTNETTQSNSKVSRALGDSIRRMPEVESLTCVSSGDANVRLPDGSFAFVKHVSTDADYWRVFGFRFLGGRAFSEAECEARSQVCVVSASLARKVFGHTDVVGRELATESETWQILGVVEEGSSAMSGSYAHMWTPVCTKEQIMSQTPLLGSFTLFILLRKPSALDALRQRVARMEERINAASVHGADDMTLHVSGQPDYFWQSPFRINENINMMEFVREVVSMLLAFLLIPAMNMCSMVASRVNGRISEFGIRRAYGATRRQLLWQVLQENFLLTLIAGIGGLLLSYVMMITCADWLPFIFETFHFSYDEKVSIHPDMLFSGWVMAAVLVVCLVLNLVSAAVPTLWALRKPVTEEINHRR